MNNKQLYKETFDAMQMSEESIRKVKNMSEKMNQKRRLKTGFRAAIAAACLVAVFAIGNAAVYASTGSSLVERVSLYINGEKTDVDRITKGKDKNGNDYYKIELDGTKEKSAGISTAGDVLNPDHVETPDSAKSENIPARLEKEGRKIYLLMEEGEKKIDITKDFEDGRAEGEFQHSGKTCRYIVSGTVEEHTIDIEAE